jgi:hypothetical protein
MSQIFAQAVGPTNQPVAWTQGSGTSAQVIKNGSSALVLTVGGQFLNGKPFVITAQGFYKSHGASQTMAIGFQGAAYSTSAFSGTQLGTGTASGTMTAGTVYPWFLQAEVAADNTSGILTGFYTVLDGVTPTLKAPTILANLLTGITFGTNNVGTNVTNPLAAAQTPALQFALTFTAGVSDTAGIVSVTSFYATTD